jgi:hypothetical protein
MLSCMQAMTAVRLACFESSIVVLRNLKLYLKSLAVIGMVGKTSMITRFARGVMTDNYKKTIGTGTTNDERDLTECGLNCFSESL